MLHGIITAKDHLEATTFLDSEDWYLAVFGVYLVFSRSNITSI